MASALLARPAFSAVSSGFLGTSDGWTDLERDFQMDFSATASPRTATWCRPAAPA